MPPGWDGFTESCETPASWPAHYNASACGQPRNEATESRAAAEELINHYYVPLSGSPHLLHDARVECCVCLCPCCLSRLPASPPPKSTGRPHPRAAITLLGWLSNPALLIRAGSPSNGPALRAWAEGKGTALRIESGSLHPLGCRARGRRRAVCVAVEAKECKSTQTSIRGKAWSRREGDSSLARCLALRRSVRGAESVCCLSRANTPQRGDSIGNIVHVK